MHAIRRIRTALAATGAVALSQAVVRAAHAQVPRNWELGLQAPGSPSELAVQNLNDLLTWIISGIVAFVAVLMLYVMWRFNAKRHPVPTRTTHNTIIEILWTTIPVVILVVIAIPSFRLIYYQNKAADPAMTIQVTGHQWYWEYAYPDQGGIHFTSYMVPDNKLAPDQKKLRRLAVDHPLVVPVGEQIRVLETSGDVIHSWYIPSLGVQRYAIPGREIETWFEVSKPGDYYGECNQICGLNHDAMAIEVKAVSKQDFQAWLVHAKTQFSADAAPSGPTRLASAR